VIGRFANRRFVYVLFTAPRVLPVRSGTVVFVIAPSQGIESISPSQARRTINELLLRPGVTALTHKSGVVVLEWKPPIGTTTITLPG
jgi:hypothetical protein